MLKKKPFLAKENQTDWHAEDPLRHGQNVDVLGSEPTARLPLLPPLECREESEVSSEVG